MIDDIRKKYSDAWLLYLSGQFQLKEIAEMMDISYCSLLKYSGTHQWNRVRREIQAKAGRTLREDVAKRIERARVQHQNFMIDQLDETASGIEMKVIGETDPEDPKNEKVVRVGDKLDLLEQQHRIAASVLKLDDMEKPDPSRTGFEFLMALGTTTLPDKTNANAGILRSNNALPDESDTPENTKNGQVFEVIAGIARPIEIEPAAVPPEEIIPQPITRLHFK